MKIIRTRVATHHNRQRVLLIFDYDPVLVGHKNSKTPIRFFKTTGQATEIYTHITKSAFNKIKSPIDSLKLATNE